MRRLAVHGLAAALLAAVLSVVVALPADAAPDSGDGLSISRPSTTQTSAVCATDKSGTDYQYLPVERWSGATSQLHVRSNGGLVDTAPTTRNLQGTAFAAGDFLYSVTTKFVSWSTQFCPLARVGGAVDYAGAALGKALVNSSLLAGILIITMVSLLVQAFRNRDGAWAKRLTTKLLVLALFSIMVAGSAGSRGGGIDGDYTTPYTPGRGSPGWFATTIDRVVTELSAAPAAVGFSQAIVDTKASGDQLDCAPYLGALQKGYIDHATPPGGVLKSAAAPALTVSNLWQVSGYNAWVVGQFGSKNLNGSTRVACRMLDRNANIPTTSGSFMIDGSGAVNDRSAASVVDVMSRVPDQKVPLAEAAKLIKSDAPAWRPLTGADQDKAWVAWATCVPQDGQLANITRRDGWKAPAGNGWLIADDGARKNAEQVNGSSALNGACYAFFNTAGTSVDNIFDWGEGDKQLKDHANEMPASIYDFISALHGTNQTSATTASLAYVVAALGVAIVFGGLGLAVLLVKIVALVMLFSVFFCMAAVLLPNADNTRLVTYAKEYVGLSLFGAFAVFVMGMVTLFTKVIYLILAAVAGGPNSTMTMLLGGLAPVLAAFALHRAFVRIGMPSPMTVKGATSWGTAMAGGATGGALAGGIGRISDAARGWAANRGRSAAAQAAGLRGKSQPGGSSTSQKSAVQPPAGSSQPITASAAVGAPAPEQVLGDPNATPSAKRAAQRQLADERRAIKQERHEAKQTSQPRRAAPPTKADRVAHLAGQAVDATRTGISTGMSNRVLDVRRWANNTVTHPVRSLGHVVRRAPVGAATLIGAAAVGGLPGVAAVGGAYAAKRVATVARHRVADHSHAKQAAIRDYRRRLANDTTAPSDRPRPGPRPPRPGPGTDWVDAVDDGT